VLQPTHDATIVPSRVIMVIPEAGGNVHPSLRIGRALAGRGHQVTVLGHEQLRSAATAASLTFEPFVEARAWQPVHDRTGPRTLLGWLALASDRGIGRDLQRVARACAPDIVVVDCMIPAALPVALQRGVPTAMIMHTLQEYWRDQWSWTSPMGAWLRLQRRHPTMHCPDLTVVTTLPALDPGPAPLPRSIRVGPILGRLGEPSRRDSALPVLVSLSTISYPDQHDVLQRILETVATLPIQALVTNPTGLQNLRVPPNARVEPFLPHEEVMSKVRAVICHGGHGTTMMALAHGLPVLVVPLTRHADHELVGRTVEKAGVGRMIHKGSDTAALAGGITETLAIDPHRIQSVANILRSSDGALAAAQAIERLAS
jgi:UDP:flavonoid glycosyltransferase YjiC (YdhE family)